MDLNVFRVKVSKFFNFADPKPVVEINKLHVIWLH